MLDSSIGFNQNVINRDPIMEREVSILIGMLSTSPTHQLVMIKQIIIEM
jgi:hypothetical protein